MAGLKAAGFEVVSRIQRPAPGDMVVTWNRYGQHDREAQRFEAAGAAVVIAENGYIGHHADTHAKPYTVADEQLYALALWQHNGAGQWWVGGPGRWRGQGIEVCPWRQDGEHVLVLPQRGIGPAGVAMPADWPHKTVRRLQEMTGRPVRLRAHPGNAPAKTPLEADLDGCWAVVTWGSGAAIKALCAGVPVFCDWLRWIGAPAVQAFAGEIEHPLMHDGAREAMLDRLAWAQWTVNEITTGEPFRRLLSLYERRLVVA